MSKETNWSEEELEELAELYIKLFPFILRDFVSKSDLHNILLNNFVESGFSFGLDLESNPEGIKKALEYLNLINNGENLKEKVKPVIES